MPTGNISRLQSPPISETCGLMLVEFLNPEFPEYRSRGPKAFAYLYAFARLTYAEMTAVLVSASRRPIAGNAFSKMLHANSVTDCPSSEILIPEGEDIMRAEPISDVLPGDVLREASITYALLKPILGLPN